MEVFEVLAVVRRRQIVELVARGERSAGDIAAAFDVSRPAISQHLSALVDAGVLAVRQDGRRRLYSLRPESLTEAGDWLEEQRRRWASALDGLEKAMRDTEGPP